MVDAELEDDGLKRERGEAKIRSEEMDAMFQDSWQLRGAWEHLLASIGLLSGGNALRDALETLGLVLLGLRLVPWKR